VIKYLAGLAFVAAAFLSSHALADEAPKANVGLSGKLLAEMPLAPEFTETGNRHFRMRVLKLEKGGVVALHSHEERPSVEYILSGHCTEFRDGGEKVYNAGDVVAADHTVNHWWRNDGEEPVVILAVDIYQPAE